MPRTLSAEEYKELGKRYYGKKDYQKAIDTFTEGIQACVFDAQLYDFRAAAYDKLEDHKSALADGRSMIKAMSQDPRGYLRVGHTLQKMNKKQQALQIYALGLGKIPASNAQINLLRGAHDKLNRELCPPKAVDPLTQLPIEIVQMIMANLKFHEVVSCLRVSKQWKLFLQSFPDLWLRMDLFKPGRGATVHPGFVKTCISMAKGGITYARLTKFHNRAMLQHLVKSCQSLQSLEFGLTKLGPDSILEAVVPARSLQVLKTHADVEIPFKVLNRILKIRPTLQEMSIQNLAPDNMGGTSVEGMSPFLQMQKLALRTTSLCLGLTQSSPLNRMIEKMPNLKCLELDDGSSFTGGMIYSPKQWPEKLQTVRLQSKIRFKLVAKLPKNLTSLHLLVPDIEVQIGLLNHNELPQLESLHYPWNPLIIWDDWIRRNPILLSHFEFEPVDQSTLCMLKDLQVSCSAELQEEEFAHLLQQPRLRHLEHLGFHHYAGILFDDAKIEELCARFTDLKTVHIEQALITGISVKHMVHNLKHLHTLSLIGCDRVGQDALDWAASQGVTVKTSVR